MSFPSSPTNNQTITVNGISYIYSEANTSWKRVATTINTTQLDDAYTLAVSAASESSTATTTATNAYNQSLASFTHANNAFNRANTFSFPSSGIVSSNGSSWSTSYATTGSGTVLTLNTNPIITNPTVTNYIETPYVVDSSTALTIDLSNGTVQVVTLTGSPTITMPVAVAGKSFIMFLKTGLGSYTVTWSTVKWPANTPPTVTSTASKMDIFSFFSDGTNWYGTTVGQNYTP